ncbi:hypothetical protein [Nostoc sp. LPT]|nr:hypothetical protein [Nostoc sp. LPT]
MERTDQLIGCANLSEEDFAAFVRQTIAENPAALYVEDSKY